MERYKRYLDLFSDFVSAGISYKHVQALENVGGDTSNKKDIVKDLKKKAAILYKEFKKLPESLQVPEVEEKILSVLKLN